MASTLRIIPDIETKELVCEGTIAVRESVALTVVMPTGAMNNGDDIHVRIRGKYGDVAKFPLEENDSWETKHGFGLEKLKTCPVGFPRDYQYVKYLRLKNYCCWHRVADDFFEGDKWLSKVEPMFRAAKPMQDFINNVVDDYE